LPQIQHDTRIEGLLPLLAANPLGLDVVNAGGDYLGTLTAASLIATLAKAEADRAPEAAHG
jgi:CBS-domain-containing membrane protein